MGKSTERDHGLVNGGHDFAREHGRCEPEAGHVVSDTKMRASRDIRRAPHAGIPQRSRVHSLRPSHGRDSRGGCNEARTGMGSRPPPEFLGVPHAVVDMATAGGAAKREKRHHYHAGEGLIAMLRGMR